MDWPFVAGSTFCWSPEFVVYIATGLPRVGPFDVTGLCGHSDLFKVIVEALYVWFNLISYV